MPQCFVSPGDVFLNSDPTGPQGAAVLREFICSALLHAHGSSRSTRRVVEQPFDNESAPAVLEMISMGLKLDFAPEGELEVVQLDPDDFEEVEETVYGEREKSVPPAAPR